MLDLTSINRFKIGRVIFNNQDTCVTHIVLACLQCDEVAQSAEVSLPVVSLGGGCFDESAPNQYAAALETALTNSSRCSDFMIKRFISNGDFSSAGINVDASASSKMGILWVRI